MDKILVFGDSITYGKWDSEGGWVTRLRKHVDEKYNIGKGGGMLVYNMGIPGEVAIRMVNRIKQELEFRMTNKVDKVLVIFAIGVNDSCPNNWMTNTQTPKNAFKLALKAMINMAKDKNCEVIVLGLAPVNTTKPTKRGLQFTNEEVSKYDAYISEVCKELNITKIDIFDTLMKQGYSNLLVDVVHPNSEGHKMIFEIVKAELGL
jgi:lysophospholipase L1-like esterase